MHKEITEKLELLFQGQIPTKIEVDRIEDKEQQLLAETFNKLFTLFQETRDFIIPLSKGELDEIDSPPNNFLSSPFKELHSRLLHLTWQAKQVAAGDYKQRVDFMGDFSEAFNHMVESLDNNEKQLKNKISELEKALFLIKRLEGFLPTCSNCKKIRIKDSDPMEQKNWAQLESYISKNSDAQFTHSICPECMEKLYPELKD